MSICLPVIYVWCVFFLYIYLRLSILLDFAHLQMFFENPCFRYTSSTLMSVAWRWPCFVSQLHLPLNWTNYSSM